MTRGTAGDGGSSAAGSSRGEKGDQGSQGGQGPSGWRRHWPLVKRVAPWLLAAVVVALLARQAQGVDWPAAWEALKAQPPAGLATAFGLAWLSYLLFASYDLIGRHETGHDLPRLRTLRIAAICYAFNLNLGSLVGALALKLRLYGGAGVKLATAGHVIAVSIASNWLGYLAAGGLVLALAPPPLPDAWALSTTTVRLIGAVMLTAALAYVARGLVQGRRTVTVHGRELQLPGGRVVLWQLAVSIANWALMGLIVWVLLQQRIDYPTVLAVLLLAAIAGVVTHVPAGLGVIEAVFVACLGDQLPPPTLLAALLAYRGVYYLIPLALATAGYALSEAGAGVPGRSAASVRSRPGRI